MPICKQSICHLVILQLIKHTTCKSDGHLHRSERAHHFFIFASGRWGMWDCTITNWFANRNWRQIELRHRLCRARQQQRRWTILLIIKTKRRSIDVDHTANSARQNVQKIDQISKCGQLWFFFTVASFLKMHMKTFNFNWGSIHVSWQGPTVNGDQMGVERQKEIHIFKRWLVACVH